MTLAYDPPAALEWESDDIGFGIRPSWHRRAVCRDLDPDVMFPHDEAGVREARRYCAACPVRTECLEYALRTEERFGVWGGVSQRGRKRMLDERGVQPLQQYR